MQIKPDEYAHILFQAHNTIQFRGPEGQLLLNMCSADIEKLITQHSTTDAATWLVALLNTAEKIIKRSLDIDEAIIVEDDG